MISNLHRVRHDFEFQMLPQLLFHDPEMAMQLDAETLFACWERLCHLVGLSNPYRVEDCQVRSVEYEDGLRMTVLHLPEPDSTPLCRRIYLC